MKALTKVSRFIAKHQLATADDRLIVGLSGGSDSVTLLHILIGLGYKCMAAHCNFHLRGKESERDEDFVKKLCRELAVPLETIDFDTHTYAEMHRISIEMAARDLRYAWFEELSLKHSIQFIAVAHHRDDSVETVLLNLIRGTGVRGLTGMSPKNGKIIRPLLCLTKDEINQYITENDLHYVDDSSNQETVFFRNKIRLEILPTLEQLNPSVKEAVNRMSAHLAQVEHIYLNYIDDCRKKVWTDNLISIDELEKLLEPEAILFELLSPYGFNSEQLTEIYQSLHGISGKIFLSATHRAIKDRNHIIIDPIAKKNAEQYTIDEGSNFNACPIALSMEVFDYSPSLVIPKTNQSIYIDKDKLTFPLTLRKWQQGDWFVPFGMKGRKKISDYFNDSKFSLQDKESAWLLTSGNNIVWIVGHRSDNRFRISEETKRIVKIRLS